jgi:hypothetical protein
VLDVLGGQKLFYIINMHSYRYVFVQPRAYTTDCYRPRIRTFLCAAAKKHQECKKHQPHTMTHQAIIPSKRIHCFIAHLLRFPRGIIAPPRNRWGHYCIFRGGTDGENDISPERGGLGTKSVSAPHTAQTLCARAAGNHVNDVNHV